MSFITSKFFIIKVILILFIVLLITFGVWFINGAYIEVLMFLIFILSLYYFFNFFNTSGFVFKKKNFFYLVKFPIFKKIEIINPIKIETNKNYFTIINGDNSSLVILDKYSILSPSFPSKKRKRKEKLILKLENLGLLVQD